jgi:hypothetical protein
MNVTTQMIAISLVMGSSLHDPDQTGWTRIAVEDKMVSITFEQAEEIARNELKKSPEFDFVIIDSDTKEYPFGWVFTYVPRKFLEKRDIMNIIVGRSPFIVNREGEIFELPFNSDGAIESYLKEWLATHPH